MIPDIRYDVKPVKYPFSSSDFVTAKNFFRRYKLNDDVFDFALYYNKYAVIEGERLDQVSEKFYDSPNFDWIIAITNNLVNPLFDWPTDDYTVRKFAEKKYDDPYSEILYYETREVKTDQVMITDESFVRKKVVALEGGLKVSKKFYDGPFTYYDGSTNVTVPGSSVSFAVTALEHEIKENEKKREIYILKQELIPAFISEFKSKNRYTKSSDFISNKLKKTGV
jgi:hypothetical protein